MMTAITRTFTRIATAIVLTGALSTSSVGQIADDKPYTYLQFEQLELAPMLSERPISLAATSWTGGDINRLWIRAEGEQSTHAPEGEVEAEALYGRMVTPFFDAVAGVRVDTRWGEDPATRALLAVGLQGLAPYRVEVAPTLYVSQAGNVSAHIEAMYGFLFTQRLILEPEVEVGAAVQEVPEWGIGSGINHVTAGARLRYEIHRKLAPYVGYSWSRSLGEAADFVHAAGAEVGHGTFVFGLRMWR